MKRIEVAAGILVSPPGQVLLCSRPEGKPYPGYWEFPGGKIEPGESAAEALARELMEEIGIRPTALSPWITRVFHYTHAVVRLSFFRVTAWDGEPEGLEGQALAWQDPQSPSVFPILPANAPILRALGLPVRYGVTQASGLGESVQLEKLEAALEQGLRLIQIREKGMDDAALERFAGKAIAMASGYGARVLLNSGLRVARSVGAHGVHLTSAELMRLDAKPDFECCGASVHDARELDRAARLDLDFAVLGNVLETPSHPGKPGIGWDAFRRIAAEAPIPVYAIGGMKTEHLALAQQHGAHGIAMLRDAWR